MAMIKQQMIADEPDTDVVFRSAESAINLIEISQLGQEEVKTPSHEDDRLWSVSTILATLNKEALVHWAARETAKAAIADPEYLDNLVEIEGEESAIKWLANARNRPPVGAERTAMELGTAVHAELEYLAVHGKRCSSDDETRPFVDQFEKWAEIWQPEWIGTEVTVFSPRYRYAGTADGYMKVNGVPVIIDFKTSRKIDSNPYPQVSLQLAAYRYAEYLATWRARRTMVRSRRYYLLNEQERHRAVKPPVVEGGLVIKITPEACLAYPAKCDESVFESFKFLIETARWNLLQSKVAIGKPLEAGEDFMERLLTFPEKKKRKDSPPELPSTDVNVI